MSVTSKISRVIGRAAVGLAIAAAVMVGLVGPSAAQAPVTVGGAPMYANRNIIQNAVNSKDHTILVAAVKAAGEVSSTATR